MSHLSPKQQEDVRLCLEAGLGVRETERRLQIHRDTISRHGRKLGLPTWRTKAWRTKGILMPDDSRKEQIQAAILRAEQPGPGAGPGNHHAPWAAKVWVLKLHLQQGLSARAAAARCGLTANTVNALLQRLGEACQGLLARHGIDYQESPVPFARQRQHAAAARALGVAYRHFCQVAEDEKTPAMRAQQADSPWTVELLLLLSEQDRPRPSDIPQAPAAAGPPGLVLHRLLLRKGLRIEVALPEDLSLGEVKRIAAWLEAMVLPNEGV